MENTTQTNAVNDTLKDIQKMVDIVKRDGEVSSAFAFGGANRQVELLKAEGVGFLDDSHVDMKRCCVRALPLILEE